MNTEESAYVRAWRFLGGVKPADAAEPATAPQESVPKRRRKAVKKPLPALHGAARPA